MFLLTLTNPLVHNRLWEVELLDGRSMALTNHHRTGQEERTTVHSRDEDIRARCP